MGVTGLALPWLAGTLVALWVLPASFFPLAPLPMLALAIGIWLKWRQVWLLCFAAGMCWTCLRIDARLDDQLAAALAGQDFEVTGWIDGFPRRRAGQVSFSLAVLEASRSAKLPSHLRLTWYEPAIELRAGATLDLRVRLRQSHGFANPAGFDFERWLFVEGYGATGYVRDGRLSSVRAPFLASRWLRFRASVAARIRETVESPDAQALLIALAIGERFAFGEQHWTTLRRTGTSHLVAISGLHVGIVSVLLFFVARALCLRGPAVLAVYDLEIAAAMSLSGASVYAALAGFTVPTQRALIMLAVAMAILLARRATTMAVGLSAALLFVLIWDPLAPLSPSFWLSFAAVAILWQLGVGRSGPTKRMHSPLRHVAEAARTQWGISLGLAPVVAYLFGEISLISPVVNFVAIPLFGLVLVPLTLAATLALLLEPLGSMLFACAEQVAQLSYRMLAWSATAPWAALPLPALGLEQTLLLFAGAICSLPSHALPGRYLGWLAMLAAIAAPSDGPSLGGLRATVLDVGHGLAVLIRTRDHALLYDTGASYPSGFDVGREIVLPVLRSKGISRLDRVLVSHADNDHAGGLESILSAYPDTELLAGPDLDTRNALRCSRGQRWSWDGVVFEILHPPPSFPSAGNDSSCVLRVRAAGRGLLLTGDLERLGEESLRSAGLDIAADVVVVPHHGSSTSSSASLTTASGPRFALVSAGYANRWGFPKPDVTARWERAGATVLVTGLVGAISVNVRPGGRMLVDTERGARARPWQFHAAP